jgi:hypothetical protein
MDRQRSGHVYWFLYLPRSDQIMLVPPARVIVYRGGERYVEGFLDQKYSGGDNSNAAA